MKTKERIIETSKAIGIASKPSNHGSKSAITFMVKEKEQVIGFISYQRINSDDSIHQTVLIKDMICESNAAQFLITESMMHLWEMGYQAVFTAINNPTLLLTGFKAITPKHARLLFNKAQIWGYSLAWNGVSNYLNQSMNC